MFGLRHSKQRKKTIHVRALVFNTLLCFFCKIISLAPLSTVLMHDVVVHLFWLSNLLLKRTRNKKL